MAEITALSLEQAKNVYQDYYGNNYVYQNSLRRPNGNFLLALETAATGSITVDQGKGLSWYVRQSNRAGGGYAVDTTGGLAHLAASPEAGSQVRVAFDEIYIRTSVSGKELRSASGQEATFVDLFKSLNEDATSRYTELRTIQLLGLGTGELTTITGAGGGAIADAASGTMPVADIELLGEAIGLSIDVYQSNGTTLVNAGLQITAVTTQYGAGTITVTNNSGSSFTPANGQRIFIQQSNAKSFLLGLKYCIDDGTNYPTYPREVSSASQVGLDRSTAAWAGLRAQLITTSSDVQLTFNHLDDLDDRISTRAGIPLLDRDGYFVGTDLMYVCRPSHYRSLQDAARTIGRQYTLSIVEGREDNGLRFNAYNGRGFLLNPFAQPDQCMLVSWPDVAVGWEQRLQPITQGEYGPLKQTNGDYDVFVATWSERMNMAVTAPRNCGRISGVIGRGDSA